EDPLEVARQFESASLSRLHLVDLDGTKAGHVVNHHVLEQIATHTNLQIDFCGGVLSDADIELVFGCGAKQVTGGSIAIKNRPLFLSWIEKYGSEKIILGADARNGKIAISGWQETSEIGLSDFLDEFQSHGIKYVICTDISKDGNLQGPAVEIYKNIRLAFPGLRVIASGGVSSTGDIFELNEIGLHGVIIGKAIYEGRIELEELARLQSQQTRQTND
ncbi:MAG: HisA/HisF-related TIM barrel protein, partial [bacterium]